MCSSDLVPRQQFAGLAHGLGEQPRSLFPRHVKLVRHGGPLGQLLDGLGASTMLRLYVVKDAQLVLNLPTPLKAFDHAGR